MTAPMDDAQRVAGVAKEAARAAKHPEAMWISLTMRSLPSLERGSSEALVAQVLGFMFHPRDVDQPFHPESQGGGMRSLIPSDLTLEQRSFLRGVLDRSDDPEIVARLGDVLWLTEKDAAAARRAIAAYLSSASRLEADESWHNAVCRYERAARLARQLGKGEPLLTQTMVQLEERLGGRQGQKGGGFTRRGLTVLYEMRRGDPASLATFAEAMAVVATNDLESARQLYDLAAKFFHRAGNSEASERALERRAELFVAEAEGFDSAGSYIGSHQALEKAYQAFRQRPALKSRLPEIQRKLNVAGAAARNSMTEISHTQDVTEIVEQARSAVRGLPLDDAVFVFTMLCSPLDPAALRKDVEKNLSENSLAAMFDSTAFDNVGRKVDLVPSIMASEEDEHERAMLGHIHQLASQYRGFNTGTLLVPGLRQILEEHAMDSDQVEALLEGSSLINPDRKPIFVRGLEAGFTGDLSTAIHLLIPQMENALRNLLKSEDVLTTKVDADGFEDEQPLGWILSHSKLREILGASLAYDLRDLLDRQPGSKVRNLMAHGMLTHAELGSATAFYVWWLVLRMVISQTPAFRSFVERRQVS